MVEGKNQKRILVSAIFLICAFFLADLLLLLPFALERGVVENFEIEGSVTGEYAEPILRISEISGPMIDSQAAFDSKVEEISCEVSAAGQVGTDLPAQIWVSLLAAYVLLMVFNLSYGSNKDSKLRFAWELLYTAFFLVLWLRYDRYAGSLWFPLYILKFGILIYLGYLYFFWKRRERIF